MDFDLFDTETALRLLLSSAEAIEDGDLKRADELLQKILILADQSTFGFGDQRRVVKYFADALVRRAYGLHPASSYFTFPVDPAPYYHYNSYYINYVIKKVIDDEKNASNGNRRLHLIDFPVPYDNNYFEGSVLRTLTTFSGDPLPVRVSYILPPFLKKYVEFSRKIMEFLTKDAMNLNVKLENELKVVYANSLAEVDEDKLDFKTRREDEMVVVYYKFKLHKLVRDAEAMKREFVRLKEINPTIVIMLDFYSNHSDFNFLTCFKDSFQYSSNTCTCWGEADSGFGRNEYWWECNRDACEGNNLIRRHQTLSEWQRLFSMGGFSRIPLNHTKDDLSNEEECLLLTERHILDNQTSLKIMGKEEECLILGYKGCPMFFLSAWKPKVEDGHFNSTSTNHQFRQDFNPNPLPLQPLQPFSEGLILNRLAALAEIHDISKDLCCKYKLSLALTWASKVNNMNETISDPNKKHAFFI
ncbi:DELLA protein 2-like [Gossypium arboreum]|uniref:DELLA protein 2-like n=1 Tax=Gossypium arboreum TaxID=29729 RepID=UPI0022F17B07|nr:DELLA protein 2-like [Gossypium arboreum]